MVYSPAQPTTSRSCRSAGRDRPGVHKRNASRRVFVAATGVPSHRTVTVRLLSTSGSRKYGPAEKPFHDVRSGGSVATGALRRGGYHRMTTLRVAHDFTAEWLALSLGAR